MFNCNYPSMDGFLQTLEANSENAYIFCAPETMN